MNRKKTVIILALTLIMIFSTVASFNIAYSADSETKKGPLKTEKGAVDVTIESGEWATVDFPISGYRQVTVYINLPPDAMISGSLRIIVETGFSLNGFAYGGISVSKDISFFDFKETFDVDGETFKLSLKNLQPVTRSFKVGWYLTE